VEIGLSIDILEMLERRVIDGATIPKEVYKRLAKALQQPLATIETYLGHAERKQLARGISEEAATYHAEVQSKVQKQSFRDAVDQSIQLSNEQKDSWRSILLKPPRHECAGVPVAHPPFPASPEGETGSWWR
jgi:hypothetical protein